MKVLDQAARDTARRELGRNIVVEAGAGTGKTTLLTDRILFLLVAGGPEKKGLALTEIVALTFTEKAAAEIQTRLTDRLTDVLAVLDGRLIAGPRAEERAASARDLLAEAEKVFRRTALQVRAAAEKALYEMDRSEIGTIHSFASRILRLFPVQGGVDPSFKIDDGGQYFDELFEAEWALWLDRELGPEPARKAKWLDVLPLAALKDVTELARALCREAAAEAKLGPAPELADRFRALAREFAELGKIRVSPGSSRILQAIGTVSAHFQALSEGLGKPPALPAVWLRNYFKSEKAKDWPKNWQSLEGRELYAEGARLAAEVSAESEALVRRAAELAVPFAAKFRELYAQKGFIGFEGLLIRARNLLRDDRDVRRALKERFRAVLIDEFQDTDPLQGELLLYLSERPDSSAEDWRDASFRLEDGKVLVVGDPKQSIYRFRGADMRAYETFTQRLRDQGALKCDLQTNFRSHAGLVEPVNAVFGGLMREEPGLQPNYLPLHPRPGGKEPAESVHWVLTPGREDGWKAAEAQRLEARWIAEWIGANCGAGKPHELKHVAVLFRSSSPLAVYLDAFKEQGIRYVVESDKYFYGAQEVIDFVNLLRVVDNPGDGISLLGLLRSPLAGLDDAEIYGLYGAGFSDGVSGAPDCRRQLPAAPRLSAEGRRRLAGVWGLLGRLHAEAGKEPLGEFIDRLLRDSFFLELCSEAYHGEQTVSNLMKFRRLAAEAADERGATLKEFIASVVRSMDESAEEGESPLADEWLDAVRILTVHKAKGLEYPVVFLPNMTGGTGGNDREEAFRLDWASGYAGLRLPRVKAADLNMAMIERDERSRQEREYVRLLYVAATRAKEKLFLLGQAEPKDNNSFASFLSRAGAWPAEPAKKEWKLAGRDFGVTRLAPPSPAATAAAPKAKAGAPRVLPLRELAGLWKGRLETPAGGRLFDSPSRPLNEPDKVVVHDTLAAGAAPGRLLGELCHKVLETWNYGSKDDDVSPAVETCCAVLKRRHPVADWDELAGEARQVLGSFLKSDAGKFLREAEILGREVPFLFPHDGTVMRGAVDVIYRQGGRLWAADFKTGRGSDVAERAEHYGAQARAYRRAVESATGEPCGFHLIFLRSGQVVEVP